ncbi:MAG: metal-dependent transcriptional regulator [Nitrospiraceae bacterium]|nr:metal-dependent transcriptional regulator [Nitrospiraceae bacterium]
MVSQERIDEALELLWLLEEEKKPDFNRFKLSSDDENFEELLAELKKQKLLIVIDDHGLKLTEEGRKLAKDLIRRHRLAEQLFTEVFELPEKSIEADACKMEHILSENLTERVCTFLGHPPKCPHGKPIPRGECCKKYKIEIEPLVVRLTDFEVGVKGRIVFIVSAETSRLNKLSSMGISAGSIIKLLQKKPSYVIQIDEATIAVDPEIAKEIFVKKTT